MFKIVCDYTIIKEIIGDINREETKGLIVLSFRDKYINFSCIHTFILFSMHIYICMCVCAHLFLPPRRWESWFYEFFSFFIINLTLH